MKNHIKSIVTALAFFITSAAIHADPVDPATAKNGIKSVMIAAKQDLTFQVPEGRTLTILNFIQNGVQEKRDIGSVARGSVALTKDGKTATVLTATDVSTQTESSKQPFSGQVVIAGPATIKITAVNDKDLTLLLSYKLEAN